MSELELTPRAGSPPDAELSQSSSSSGAPPELWQGLKAAACAVAASSLVMVRNEAIRGSAP